MHIFKGTEVEGPEEGELTLFIPKNAENRSDFLILAKKHNIKRLYFGAGNDRGIKSDIIPLLETIPCEYSVLLEITDQSQLKNLPTSFLWTVKIIFVLLQKGDLVLTPSVFKIETKNKVHWYELFECSQYSNSINDDLYKKDEKA